jgi:integrase
MSSYALLAAYLDETKDYAGTLEFVRQKWPKSLPTCVSEIKNLCLSLDTHGPNFQRDLDAAIVTAKRAATGIKGAERTRMKAAIASLTNFAALPLKQKVAVQKSIRTRSYSGVSLVDDLISAIDVLPEHLKKFRLTTAEMNAFAKKNSDSLQTKSMNSVTVKGDELIERCEEILRAPVKGEKGARPKAPTAFDLACALALLTGRRMTEIFKTAEFERVSGDTRSLLFSGQIKKGCIAEDEAYVIPVLADAALIVAGFERLRRLKDASELSNKEVNLRWSTSANDAARRMLGADRHFHDLRATYAVLAYTAALPHTLSLNAFVGRVLGHVGLSHSLNYTALHVEDFTLKFVWKPIAAGES